MRVERRTNGVTWKWAVVDGKRVLAEFDTNEDAWAYMDKRETRPLHFTRDGADRHGAHQWLPPEGKGQGRRNRA